VIDAVSTAGSSGIALSTVDREYRRNRRSVFAGIFAGYAAYYLVRNNLALAIPDILAAHPSTRRRTSGGR
jgi:Sugar phosphate permease